MKDIRRQAIRLATMGLALAAAGSRAAPCAAGAGDLDPTFGDAGIVVTELSDGLDQPSAIAIQPDGKLVVAGRSLPKSEPVDGFALARYLPDGALDPSFGAGGIVRVALGDRSGYARDVAVAPDGRIVAVGTKYIGYLGRYTIINDLAVVRFLSDGSLDRAFGDAGVATAHFGNRISIAEAVILQPDGRIVAAGRTYAAMLFNERTVVARFNADGTPDRSFGSDGLVDLAPYSATWDAALQPDGRIVLVGDTSNVMSTGQRDLVVVRLRADGSLDPTFGAGGTVVADLDGRGDLGRKVLVLSDGRIVVAGYILGEARDPGLFALVRFDADGRLDPTFGRAGVATAVAGSRYCVDGPGLALQPDGALVLAGERDFAVVRFDRTGRIDPTLTSDREAIAARGRPTCAVDVAALPDGPIVVAGAEYSDNNERARFMLARFEGQAPRLTGVVDRSAPFAGETAVLTFTLAADGWLTFRGGSLTVTLPSALAAAGPVEIIPPGAGRARGVQTVVDDIVIEPGRTVAVVVPASVRDDVPPGTPVSVEAVLEPGHGHNPIATIVRFVTQGPPITAPDFALTARDTPVRIDVVVNDRDPNGDTFALAGVSQPPWGTTTFDATRGITYTPSAGYIGPDGFTYDVTDSHGMSSTGQVSVLVAERLYPLFIPLVAHPGER